MPIVEVEVEIWCAICGEGLCNQTTFRDSRPKKGMHVEPCERCLEAARQEGREEVDG